MVETGAPNGGDGNGDGIADADQANVVSLPGSTGDYLTLAVPPATSFGPVASVDPGSYGTPPSGVVLPDGLVSFELNGLVNGATTTVRIYSPSVVDANGYAKWQDGAWVVLPAARVEVNVPGGYVAVTLTDGGVGDDDGLPNGTIVDPGGLAVLTDTQPPVLSCADATSSWSPDNTAIACTATDSGSGLADAADASFDLVTSVPLGQESDSASTDARTVCDVAGNCATAGPVTGLKVDRRAPTITVTSPTNGATLTQGAGPAAAYSCLDGGSGALTCAGPVLVGQPVPTGTLGAQQFVVTATDRAGNVATSTVSYTVVAANAAPVVTADMGVVGLELVGSQSNAIVVRGSFADPNGNGPFAISVRWADGTPFRSFGSTTGSSLNAAYAYPSSGTRVVTVRVCDAAGACGTDTVSVRTGVKQKVTPVAQCVVDRGPGQAPRYSGRFGYDNAAALALWVPTVARLENSFTTGSAQRGQPQVFLPGVRRDVFTTEFASGDQTWRVNGKSASLSPSSRRC